MLKCEKITNKLCELKSDEITSLINEIRSIFKALKFTSKPESNSIPAKMNSEEVIKIT